MSNWRPGPWQLRKGRVYWHVVDAEGWPVMEAGLSGLVRQHDEAQLIATAPSMYEKSLQLAMACAELEDYGTDAEFTKHVNDLIKVLKQATGDN